MYISKTSRKCVVGMYNLIFIKKSYEAGRKACMNVLSVIRKFTKMEFV